MLRYILLILLIAAPLWGRLKIEISSDQQVYTMDDTISVTVTVTSSSKLVQLKRLPRPKGLNLVGKSKSFSQNYTFSGGRSRGQLVLTYNLSYLPKKTGRIRFKPIKLRYRGKLYTSNSLSLNVVKSDAVTLQNGQQNIFAPPFDRELFIVAKVDKPVVYVGEQVTVKYYLYYRIDVEFAETPSLPSFKDVWIEEFDKIRGHRRRSVTYKGYYFKMQLLNKVALFPMKSGELILPPFQGKFRANVFSSILSPGNPNMVYRRKSNYLKVHVKPLPEKGKAPEFSKENVGDYRFTVALSKGKVAVNEPVTLTMKIRGKGNLRNVSFPKLPQELEGFKVYEPVEKNSIDAQGDLIRGEKVLTVAIKPMKPGVYKPFNFKFNFFNPRRKQYETIDYSDLQLTVTGSATPATAVVQKKSTGEPDNHKIGVVLKPLQDQLFDNGVISPVLLYLFWFLLFALPGGYFVLVIVVRRRAHLLANQGVILSRMALKQATTALKELKRNVLPQQEHYQKVYQIIVDYIDHRFNISIKGLTGEQIELFFERKGIAQRYSQALVKEIENSEFLRFSNVQIYEDEQLKSVDQVIDILTGIDGEGAQ